MEKRMDPIYIERRKIATRIIVAPILGFLSFLAYNAARSDFKCEGSQTVVVKNKDLPDGTNDPDSHFTVYDAIDNYVLYDPSSVNKQDIVQEVEDMNPGIDFGNLQEWDEIQMPQSCTDN